jgi:signal transduction histidine kinase
MISTPLAQHLQDEFWVGEYRNYKGAEVLGTVVRLGGNRWYLVVERDFEEVLEQVSKVKQALFASTLGVLFVLIIVTIILTTSITKPLLRLVESARRIAAGELSNPVIMTKGSDEIAFLAAEFDRMRGRIAASQGRLIEQLEESEQRRLESERLAAIGTLASSLAHEIRNPLNGLSLLLSQLERSKQSDEQKLKMIDEMREEIGRLDRLVSDILDYARPLQLQKEKVGLKSFTENIINFYNGVFEEKNIQLKLNFPEDEIEVELDRDKFRQAFVNLIQNAIEAIGQGGLLSFSIELFDRGVRWTIKDSGMGMDQKSQSRLFDLFFTTKERGTGLGLSVVKKIIDAHGGKIEVNSAPKKGTEIKVTFNRV